MSSLLPPAHSREARRVETEAHPAEAVHVVPRSALNEHELKRKLINDFLGQLEYHSAEQSGVVAVRKEEIAQELERVSLRALLAWYEAFLFLRSEMSYGGYELEGLRILDEPANVLRKLIKSDPAFDIQQYLF